MNMLVDLLPDTVEVDGEKYEINTDFRISVLFELLMQDDEVTNEEKIIHGLNLYYPVVPRNIHEAVEKMLWFYRCGKEAVENDSGSDSSSGKHPEKVYLRCVFAAIWCGSAGGRETTLVEVPRDVHFPGGKHRVCKDHGIQKHKNNI